MEPPPPQDDDEERVIATLLGARPDPERLGAAPVVDAGDDAAVLSDGTAVTVDTLVEGVHWDDRLAPEDVGFKALAVSVSDLAAMGVPPRWAVLSLALPAVDAPWVEAFAEGLADACDRWGVRLVGGDTVRTAGPRVVTLTLAGRAGPPPLRRAGARPGDTVWVTGTLGLAGLGWRADRPPPEALAALRRPEPPLAFALELAADGLATAAMDLSDGLARDLPRLCAASGVGAVVRPEALPGHPDLGPDALAHQTRGGEDYQLLFTADPAHRAALLALARAHDLRLTAIGHVTEAHGARLEGRDWPPTAFAHFPTAGTR
ncbi:MAG: thiamine-phosphate kinase [Alphaproteobacteria bacterium]|nr:thiamine-phosphate kinase [Alphaproteobacteria bacterium]